MTESKKFDPKGTLMGFKSLATRNAILAILLNITNQYTNNMRTSFRAMVEMCIRDSFYPVAAPPKELAHFANQTSFRVSNHE